MKEIRFGIVGLGLMGREFASAAARWIHLQDVDFRPVITAICDTNEQSFIWFRDSIPSLTFSTTDYRQLLARDDVDAVYCAVPHNLHDGIYTDIVEAGKHLLGEKPFGIDLVANKKILGAIAAKPQLVVRCSSELPFYPGGMAIVKALGEKDFGRIVEVEAGLLHSSDLNPEKPINWKRMVEFNGEYGCMGDLGMHVLHIPLRLGWMPQYVHAQLSKIVTERPDVQGKRVACETWDNATIYGEVNAPGKDHKFPITFHTKRIAPGEVNTWFLKIIGTRCSISYSTKFPKTLKLMEYEPGGPQAWKHIDLGYESAYPTITGSIFEFGFTDSILQMWAAYCDEVAHGREGMKQPFYCVTPDETHQSHQIFTAALRDHKVSTR